MNKLLVIFFITIPFVLTAQMTYVPDDIFEQILINRGYDSGPLNDSVPTKNIDSITYLNIGAKNISDLTGIEGFIALEELDCYANKLSSLDLKKNHALKELDCSDNRLIILNVSNNPALERLICYYNFLKNLDINNNPYLVNLSCHLNLLTSLDVSNNSVLEKLDCGSNKLTSLDVSKNPQLLMLSCNSNPLKSMDLSQNPNLRRIYCIDIQLTNLDVSKNSALETFWCFSNQLTSLDVSKNPVLEQLNCSSNLLNSLDLSGNPELIKLNPEYDLQFDARDNPYLSCIKVIDSSVAIKNPNWFKDSSAFYSVDCSVVGVNEDKNDRSNITVSPNPATDYIEISFESCAILSKCGTSEIKIYNSLGECVINYEFRFTNYEKERIDVSGLPPGVYFVSVLYPYKIVNFKFEKGM